MDTSSHVSNRICGRTLEKRRYRILVTWEDLGSSKESELEKKSKLCGMLHLREKEKKYTTTKNKKTVFESMKANRMSTNASSEGKRKNLNRLKIGRKPRKRLMDISSETNSSQGKTQN